MGIIIPRLCLSLGQCLTILSALHLKFLLRTGAPRETLSLRLRKLEDYRLIERRRYCEHPPRDEYVLTPAGQALQPVLRSLRQWGERFATPNRS